ncbi:GlcG/HbpS family heme-binding protein [Methylocapsa acidiphila]|uniref:GlcG/HbpS family heme-binding protein n=1 Tax=Methylocapsa acidiphila TaxID=133552 RepID=UPI00047C8A48|nr:heme-binding protein [Methylocapsa acidiphila]
MRKLLILSAATALFSAGVARSDDNNSYRSACGIDATTVQNIQKQLATVVQSGNGGLFKPNLMWSAIVDRQGVLCSVIKTGDAWPGSRSIAIAKASAANDFSNANFALSTAMLYGPTQPGGSLYGLNNSNPFNPQFQTQGTGLGYVPGGIITFGGGVALYKAGHVIGGLGVSGDTSCADHAIAYKMRKAAGLDGAPNSDNIQYPVNPPAPANPQPAVTGFQQPRCLDTDIIP